MKLILTNKKQIVIVVHILLGIFAGLSKIPFTVLGLFVIFSSIITIIKFRNNEYPLHYFLSYLIGFELLARMLKLGPFIPYEASKYLILIFTFIVFYIENRKSNSKIGLIFLILILPSLIYIDFNETFNEGVVFNFFGYLNMVALIFYFDNRQISFGIELRNMFYVMLLPIISIISYISINAPDLDEFEFTLGALDATSGGFGSNQVATILGLGTIISLIYYIFWGGLTKLRILRINDTLILAIVSFFRGLLTFSRGGIIGGLLPTIILLVFRKSIGSSMKITKINNFLVLSVFLILGSIAVVVNEITDDQLLKRYQGESYGTLEGRKESDLNSLTSGRSDIFMADIEVFKRNMLFGAGPGKSKFERSKLGLGDENSHVEVSRMLADHGLFGVVIVILFLGYPIVKIIKEKGPLNKFLVATFFFIAIFTSFHSAMRTMVTPMFFGLACATFYRTKDTHLQIN